jgi:hypothetical protein
MRRPSDCSRAGSVRAVSVSRRIRMTLANRISA